MHWIAETESITLLSTVVAPAFEQGSIDISPVTADDLPALLARVSRNLCGHPVTDAVLRAVCPSLPPQDRAFWDGRGVGLAVRPRGGVRGSTTEGDTQVALADLESVTVRWQPQRWVVGEGEQQVCYRCRFPITPVRVAARVWWSTDGEGGLEVIVHDDKGHCRLLSETSQAQFHALRRHFAAQRGIMFTTSSGARYTPLTPQMREMWEACEREVDAAGRAAVLAAVERNEPLPGGDA